MSTLSDIEKRYFENLFDMQSGYVLDYSDATFGALFSGHKINIHSSKYQGHGSSKAKKMRGFWEIESDVLVANVLSEILDSYEASCELNNEKPNASVLEKSRIIVARLLGQAAPKSESQTAESFLNREYTITNIDNLPVKAQVISIIKDRLEEALIALKAGAYLSVIFLCGSILEAVLLGAAQKNPSEFNRAVASAKGRNGNIKQFHDWSLAQLIDVACEIGLLKPDVKKFGHGLRDFRNYIHPYEQMSSGFTPDEHTAKVCFQVLKASIAGVSGARK